MVYQSIERVESVGTRDQGVDQNEVEEQLSEIKKVDRLQDSIRQSRLKKEVTFDKIKSEKNAKMAEISNTEPNLKLYAKPLQKWKKLQKRREAAECRSEIEKFEIRNSKADRLDPVISGDDYLRKIKSSGVEKRKAADERSRRRRKGRVWNFFC